MLPFQPILINFSIFLRNPFPRKIQTSSRSRIVPTVGTQVVLRTPFDSEFYYAHQYIYLRHCFLIIYSQLSSIVFTFVIVLPLYSFCYFFDLWATLLPTVRYLYNCTFVKTHALDKKNEITGRSCQLIQKIGI